MPDVLDFISRAVPWGTGFVNLHWRTKNQRGLPGRSFTDPEDLLAYAEAHKNVADIYFCLSSQSQRNERRKSNVVAHKSIYLDVDGYKPEKSYGSLEEASDAIQNFVSASGIVPPTALVCSGGGWQAHWLSDKALTEEEWRPYAEGLWSLATKHGLRADAGVTTDSVRVLRLPGTFNHKEKTAREVKLVSLLPADYDFKSAFNGMGGPQEHKRRHIDVSADNYNAAAFADPAENPEGFEGSLGITSSIDAPMALGPLIEAGGCPHLQDAFQTKGAHFAQPLWHLDGLLATFLDDGRRLFHYMSKGHKTYEAAGTDAMFDRKVNDRSEHSLGWPSCVALESAGCKSCALCPHKGKIRSPLNLTRPAATPFLSQHDTDIKQEPVPLDVDPLKLNLPRSYRLNDKERICKRVSKIVGSTTRDELEAIFSCRIFNAYMTKDPMVMHFTTSTTLGATRDVSLPHEATRTKDPLLAALYAQDVSIVPGQEEAAVKFIKDWETLMKDAKAANKQWPYGWVIQDGGEVTGFVYGGTMYNKDGTTTPVSSALDEVLIDFMPAGQKETWFEALKLITDQPRIELEAIVAASFASPLLRITGKNGGVLCANSQTSTNKSTAVDLGNAVWGNPKEAKAVIGTSRKSLLNQMARTHNLPTYWDDVKAEMMDDVIMLANASTEGQEGHKMTSKRGRAKTGNWQSIVIISANASVHDAMLKKSKTDAAALYRVFEFPIREPKEMNSSQGRRLDSDASPLLAQLEYNHGKVGEIYAQWLGSKPDDIERITMGFIKDFEKAIKPEDAERFWVSLCGVIYAGAWFANKLGATFHLEQLWDFLEATFLALRARVKGEHLEGGSEANAEIFLSGFFKTQGGSTAVTYDMVADRGKPKPLRLVDIPDFSRFPNAHINVHWVIDYKLLRISKTAFRKYLIMEKAQPSMVMDGLKKHFAMSQDSKVRLSAGIPGVAAAPEDVLLIPIKEGTWLDEELRKKVPKSQGQDHEMGPAVGQVKDAETFKAI